MNTYRLCSAALLVVSCGSAAEMTPPADAERPDPVPAVRTVAEERRANDDAYRTEYVPLAADLLARHPDGWVAIVDGRLVPQGDGGVVPALSLVAADAAARSVAPDARHRYVFRIGEDGDVDWGMAGCELKHVVGVPFLALIERDDVEIRGLGPGQPIRALFGETLREITVPGPDARMYVRPEVGAPGEQGVESGSFCVSTGFGGLAVLPAADYPVAALWEIPGTANVYHGAPSGICRRARARLAWTGSELDFVVHVALWPE